MSISFDAMKADSKRLDSLVYFLQDAQKKETDPVSLADTCEGVVYNGVTGANIVKGAVSLFAQNPLTALLEFGSAGLLHRSRDLKSLRKEIQALTAERVKLETQVKEFSSENGKLKGHVQEFSEQNSKLKGRVEEFSSENGKLKGRVEDLGAEVLQLKAQVQRFMQENETLHASNSTFAANNRVLEATSMNLQSFIENSQGMLRDQYKEFIALKVEAATVREQLRSESEALTKARQEVQEACRELRETQRAQKDAQAQFEASNATLAQNVREFAAANRQRQATEQPVVFVVNAQGQAARASQEDSRHSHHHMQHRSFLGTSVMV